MAQTNMVHFWIKRIAVMVGVILACIAFLIFVPNPTETSSDESSEQNSVAANVTRFYEEFKQVSRDPIKERYGDYVILLDNQDNDLSSLIKDASSSNYPPINNWQGKYKERAFATGTTLMQEAKAFAEKEGYTLLWDLNQDFIVRQRFISSNTLVGMLEEISGAVDANFDHPILIYFCFKKRVLVITEENSQYLENNCELSRGSAPQYY